MSHDCDLTLLPTDSCAHCSGVKEVASEPFYEKGMEIKTLTERESEYNEVTGRWTTKERYSDMKEQLATQLPKTGRWNKTKETYGGHDGQNNFDDIELPEVASD